MGALCKGEDRVTAGTILQSVHPLIVNPHRVILCNIKRRSHYLLHSNGNQVSVSLEKQWNVFVGWTSLGFSANYCNVEPPLPLSCKKRPMSYFAWRKHGQSYQTGSPISDIPIFISLIIPSVFSRINISPIFEKRRVYDKCSFIKSPKSGFIQSY